MLAKFEMPDNVVIEPPVTPASRRFTPEGAMEPGRRRTSRRSDVQLAADQLRALDSFNLARAATERAARSAQMSRETRTDARRQLYALRRQHAAIVRRTDEQLRQSGGLLRSSTEVRAVVVHSNVWFTGALSCELQQRGIRVVAGLSCGAAAFGTSVAEQPDVVIVSDPLSEITAAQFVRELAPLAPGTLFAAQVAYPEDVQPLVDAGARAVFTRAVPPSDVAAHLVDVLVDASEHGNSKGEFVESGPCLYMTRSSGSAPRHAEDPAAMPLEALSHGRPGR